MTWLLWAGAVAAALRAGAWGARRAVSRLRPERFGLRVEGRDDLGRVTAIARTLLSGAVDAASVARAAVLRRRGETLEPFLRPFYFEGIGMGYAPRSVWDLRLRRTGFLAYVRRVHPGFDRLYLAGLGMWYEARWRHRPDRLERLVASLPPDLRFFSVEGYGFSRGLFRDLPAAAHGWRPFSEGIRRAYCHGLARGLLIRYGDAPGLILPAVGQLPPRLSLEAYSGLGMGVAFTRIDDLPSVFAWLDRLPDAGRPHYLLGATLGLYIHGVGQPEWTRGVIRGQAARLTEAQARWALEAMDVPDECARGIDRHDPDAHWRWREAILPRRSATALAAGAGPQKGALS